MNISRCLNGLYCRLALCVALSTIATVLAAALSWILVDSYIFSIFVSVSVAVLVALWATRMLSGHIRRDLDALEAGIMNLLDTDYSSNLVPSNIDDFQTVSDKLNQLSDVLRSERQSVYQRELMLDTIIENSALCVLLLDQRGYIVYSNGIARHWLREGKSVNGLTCSELLAGSPELFDAITLGQTGIFPAASDKDTLCLLSCGEFVLNAQKHQLVLLRDMTHTLSRQEAQAWKKVIRVISHELNNSLAPISSLAHSGKLMLEKGIYSELDDIFTTLVIRSRFLAEFVGSYAAIAKLPSPLKRQVDWPGFVHSIVSGTPCQCVGTLPEAPGWFDESQLYQAVQNLLKNASESGAEESSIELSISQDSSLSTLMVSDRGPGMTEEQMSKALLPFYSTKPGGSGTGLPLCREIVESHGGKLSFANRPGGGLQVKIELPVR